MKSIKKKDIAEIYGIFRDDFDDRIEKCTVLMLLRTVRYTFESRHKIVFKVTCDESVGCIPEDRDLWK